MGVNKVQLGEETLIDLTDDTVNPQVLLKGATAHGADGEPVEGAMTAVPTTTSLAVTEEGVSALDGTVGKALDDKGSQIAFYQDTDNAWHFRDWNGADTVLPFNDIDIDNIHEIYSSNSVSMNKEIVFNENVKLGFVSAAWHRSGTTAYVAKPNLSEGSIFPVHTYGGSGSSSGNYYGFYVGILTNVPTNSTFQLMTYSPNGQISIVKLT